jgi:hypothetical protein
MYPDLDPLISQAATQVITQYGAGAERAIGDIIAANEARGDLQNAKYGP